MKRSEMINILNSYIVEKSGDCDGSEILEIVEKAGMLPPKRIPTAKELDCEEDEELYEEYLYFNEYISWEPEK